MHRISIVTPSFNQGHFIEETINSVLDQQYPNLEYIVIDGGSTDNSVEVIKRYSKYLKLWVSEKDGGQVDAINKGLKHCTGEVFNWLNSDDYLEPGALHTIASAFADKSTDLVVGKVNNFSNYESEIISNNNLTAEKLMRWAPGTQFVQPGVWMRRNHFVTCGGIDDEFHYAFDWDLLIRYLYLFPNVTYLPDLLVHFRLHENSKTVSVIDKFVEEEKRIIEKISRLSVFSKLYDLCTYKIQRTRWIDHLEVTINSQEMSTGKKLSRIVRNLKMQPKDLAVTRMTLGAIRKILAGNSLTS